MFLQEPTQSRSVKRASRWPALSKIMEQNALTLSPVLLAGPVLGPALSQYCTLSRAGPQNQEDGMFGYSHVEILLLTLQYQSKGLSEQRRLRRELRTTTMKPGEDPNHFSLRIDRSVGEKNDYHRGKRYPGKPWPTHTSSMDRQTNTIQSANSWTGITA